MDEWINLLKNNPKIQEIMINPDGTVFWEKDGNMEPFNHESIKFDGLLSDIRSMIADIGGRLDRSHPVLETMINSDIRLTAVIPPLCDKGMCVNLRNSYRNDVCLDDLLESKMITVKQRRQLQEIILAKENLVIVGGTSSGKTTLLKAVMDEITRCQPHCRIISVEETPELTLRKANVVQLIRPVTDPHNEFDLSNLLKHALRMRPDRIVIGECRGQEVFTFLQALNSGHHGSLCTLHANQKEQTLQKLALLSMMSTHKMSYNTVYDMLKSQLHWVAFCERQANGQRMLMDISSCQAGDNN